MSANAVAIFPPKLSYHRQPRNHLLHVGWTLDRFLTTTCHHKLGKRDWNLIIQLGWGNGLVRGNHVDPAVRIGAANLRGIFFRRQEPIHRGAKVENIRPRIERQAADLLRGNVIRCALDPFLAMVDQARLAKIYDLHNPALGDHYVGRLNIGVQIAGLVHCVQTLRNLVKKCKKRVEAVRPGLFEVQAVHVLHYHEQLLDLEPLANAMDGVAAPQIGMVDAAADLVLGFSLVEEPLVGGGITNDVLDGKGLARFQLNGDIDLGTRTGTDLPCNPVAGKLY